MTTMHITLSDSMSDWVQTQINTGKYPSSSDYIENLIRYDQAQQALQTAITQGLNSGVSDLSMEHIRDLAHKKASMVG